MRGNQQVSLAAGHMELGIQGEGEKRGTRKRQHSPGETYVRAVAGAGRGQPGEGRRGSLQVSEVRDCVHLTSLSFQNSALQATAHRAVV